MHTTWSLRNMMADEETLEEILRERLTLHSNCFNSLIDLVPQVTYSHDDEGGQGSKFYKNKKNRAPKQVVKEALKSAKLSRLDPATHKSVVEQQAELSRKESKGTNDENLQSVEDVECSSIHDLKARLHQRIQLLRKKRKAIPHEGNESSGGKRRKRSKSKVEEKKNKSMKSEVRQNGLNGKDLVNNKKVIKNNEGKVVFSKFDFTTDVVKPQTAGEGKMKSKNYKNLLEKAENRKKKLEMLKEVDGEKAKSMAEQMMWKKALEKSEGVKQKDNPTLLRKSLKRKEKQKKKHQHEWKERKGIEKKQTMEKQKLRMKNIKERSELKKKKKMKKGGRTPGF